MLRFLDDLKTALLAPGRTLTPGTAEHLATHGLTLFGSGDALMTTEVAEDLLAADPGNRTQAAVDAMRSVKRLSRDGTILKRRDETIEDAIVREARVLKLRETLDSMLGPDKKSAAA